MRKFRSVLAVMAVAGIVVGACGDDEKSTDTTAGGSTETTAGGSTETTAGGGTETTAGGGTEDAGGRRSDSGPGADVGPVEPPSICGNGTVDCGCRLRLAEARALVEDGIPVAPLPWSSRKSN